MKPGDYVQFAHLPEDVKATPIRVREIDKDGFVRLEGRQYYLHPRYLNKVDVLSELRAGALKRAEWYRELVEKVKL